MSALVCVRHEGPKVCKVPVHVARGEVLAFAGKQRQKCLHCWRMYAQACELLSAMQ